jgi:hypothetical protein
MQHFIYSSRRQQWTTQLRHIISSRSMKYITSGSHKLHLGRDIILTNGAILDGRTGSHIDRVSSSSPTCYNMLSICILKRWKAKTLVLLGIWACIHHRYLQDQCMAIRTLPCSWLLYYAVYICIGERLKCFRFSLTWKIGSHPSTLACLAHIFSNFPK